MSLRWFTCLSCALFLTGAAAAQVTERASVSSGGAQANADSTLASLSFDGRFVAFESFASNLIPADTNQSTDVFVRDRWTGNVERVSVGTNGEQGNSNSLRPAISPDGRFVAFYSFASSLVPGDANDKADVFVRDRQSGTTELVSLGPGSVQGDGASSHTSISADGRFVSFESEASNLVPGDTNARRDAFVRDRLLGTTARVSLDPAGGEADGHSSFAVLSADGRFVAFMSAATNLVPNDTNGIEDVFVCELAIGSTERANVSASGAEANGVCEFGPAISADGRFVAFTSLATNLVPSDANGSNADVFVRDRQAGTTEIVTLASDGTQGNGGAPSMSADARFVVFMSGATLVPEDTNGVQDIFVRDRRDARTERVSVATDGVQADNFSDFPGLSPDGRFVGFTTLATNLVPGDTNGALDLLVHDRAADGFTSLCDPGQEGVISCPCANPASGAGRGCDNSSATGGAVLTVDGAAYLSADDLVFTTSGEKPLALSIVLQGDVLIAGGQAYGQGVRCVGGTLKRLYSKSASGGSITAPDFGLGEPAVSVRSAALGDPIQAGQSRWYLVYYRDPIVLGGCSTAATFNGTQSGRVSWSL